MAAKDKLVARIIFWASDSSVRSGLRQPRRVLSATVPTAAQEVEHSSQILDENNSETYIQEPNGTFR